MPAIALKIGTFALQYDTPMNAFFSSAILHVTGSPYCHAEFWFDGPITAARCFSARELNAGVGWATIDLTQKISGSPLWMILPLPEFVGDQEITTEAFCDGNVGRDYDGQGILGILNDNPLHNVADRFCSEMVFDIGQQCLGWRTDIPRWHVAPGWTRGGDRYGLFELATAGKLMG